VYEQETIAAAPAIFFREAASATAVARFWGEPPSNLGIQEEGGVMLSFLGLDGRAGLFNLWSELNSCHGLVDGQGRVIWDDGPLGTREYGVVEDPAPRTDRLPRTARERRWRHSRSCTEKRRRSRSP